MKITPFSTEHFFAKYEFTTPHQKFYTSICPPAPSEFLAMAAWKVRDQLRERSIAQIEHNLRIADAFFGRWPDLFTWRKPLAGSTALVSMQVPSVMAFATPKGVTHLPVVSHIETRMKSGLHLNKRLNRIVGSPP